MSNSVDTLAAQIVKNLEGYTTEIIDGVDEERKKGSKKAVSALRATSPKRKGNYGKGWGETEEKASGQNGISTIHNKKHYRLTHLLENGHYTRNGGWVAAQSHIKAVEDTVIEEFTSGVESVIRNANG